MVETEERLRSIRDGTVCSHLVLDGCLLSRLEACGSSLHWAHHKGFRLAGGKLTSCP